MSENQNPVPARLAAAACLLLLAACAGPRADLGLPPRPPTPPLAGADATTVRELSAQVEGLRGLTFEQPVRAASATSALVTWIVHRGLAEQRASGRYEKDEAMLRAFGFLAPEEDLEAAMNAVMEEQALGLYDETDRTLYVVSGKNAVPDDALDAMRELSQKGVDQRRMVLLHEIVHALDDQHFGLARFTDPDLDGDVALAGHALVEGEATFLMMDWLFARTAGRRLADLPSLAGLKGLKASLGGEENAALRAAPAYLREGLLFSYFDGLVFVHALYRLGGWKAVDAAWRDPPETTEQILHPKRYLEREGPVEVRLPALPALETAGWRPFGEDAQGELGLRIFLETLRGDPATGRALPPGPRGDLEALLKDAAWGGDRYRVYVREGAAPAAVWVVAFDREDAADAFVRAAGSLADGREVRLTRLSGARVGLALQLPAALADDVLTALADGR